MRIQTIGFIGLGNMAKAIIGGILQNQLVEPQQILGSAATQQSMDAAAEQFGILTETSNKEVARKADLLVLAVKPVVLPVVIEEIRDVIGEDTVVLSVAAGKTTKWLTDQFEHPVKIVRCMPNTPALVREGCSAICRSSCVTDDELEEVMKIVSSFGIAEVVSESLMDTVGAVSGAVPAYVFMFLEALADAGVKGGMPRRQAYRFAAQTVLGSAKLMLETGKHPGELKDMVCSPGGTTIEGLEALEKGGFRGTVMDAIDACIEKSKKL